MFLEAKTTQIAGKLIQKAGGKLSFLSLLKLLYFADKQMLLDWGVPMTYDEWYAMPHGPVLSKTYNLIKAAPENSGTWGLHIRRNEWDVELINDPGDDLTSEAEDEIIEKIFGEHGRKSKWQLRDLTHELPEWNDPGGSSNRITYKEVLQVAGLSADAIKEILDNIEVEKALADTPLAIAQIS